MPYDGNGQYNLPQPAYPAIPNTVIESAKYNEVLEDLRGALSTAWPRDGQAAATATMSMGGNKLTNVANGTNSGDAVNFLQVFTDPTFTGTTVLGVRITGTALTVTTTTVTLPANTTIGSITPAEIALLAGLTQNVQVALNAKANLAGGNTFAGVQVMQAQLQAGSTVPTPVPSTNNSTLIATTAFVQQVAMNANLPAQPGDAFKILYTNGSNAYWQYGPTDLPLLALGIV